MELVDPRNLSPRSLAELAEERSFSLPLTRSSPLDVEAASPVCNQPVLPSSLTANIVTAVADGSLPLEVLFALFSADACKNGLNQIIEDFFTKTPSAEITKLVTVASYVAAGIALITDCLGISPRRNSHQVCEAFKAEHKEGGIEKLKKILTLGLLVASVVLNFSWGAAADDLPVVGFLQKHLGKAPLAYALLNYSSLAIILVLGITYYALFNYGKIAEHFDQLVDLLFKGKRQFIKDFCSMPLAYFETATQVAVSTLYRLISFGYLGAAAIEQILHLNNRAPAAKAVIFSIMAETAVVTPFSRFLTAFKAHKNERFAVVAPQEYERANGYNRYFFCLDVPIALIRGGAVGALIAWSLDGSILGYNLGFAAATALAAASLKERLRVRTLEGACDDIVGKQEINRRVEIKKQEDECKKREQEGDQYEAPKEASPFERASETWDDIGKALHHPLERDPKRSIFSTPFLLLAILWIANFASRAVRGIGLYSFVTILNTLFDWGFTPAQCALIAGVPVIETSLNDTYLFLTNNTETVRDYRVAGAVQDQINPDAGLVARTVRCFMFSSPGDYSKQQLDQTLELVLAEKAAAEAEQAEREGEARSLLHYGNL